MHSAPSVAVDAKFPCQLDSASESAFFAARVSPVQTINAGWSFNSLTAAAGCRFPAPISTMPATGLPRNCLRTFCSTRETA